MKSNLRYITLLIFFFWGLSYSVIHAKIVILNGLSHIHQVNSGEQHRGSIIIKNINQEEERTVRLYQRDYLYTHTGEAHYDTPNHHQRSNTNWVNFDASLLVLKPLEEKTIFYDVNVPQTGSLTGTYWSVIMIEAIQDPVASRGRGIQLNTQVRYAIQIATNIGETGKRDLQFVGVDVQQQSDNQYLLGVKVENKGERLLIPTLEVEVFNAQGTSIGIFNAEKRKLYPTTSTQFFVALPNLPIGDYQALILANCTEDDIFGVNVDLNIK